MYKATYQSAGVNLDASEQVKNQIKDLAANTYGPDVLGGVGGFGAMYKIAGYNQPVLVSSTDPVGTKLMVAGMAGDYSNIGIDLVNACINDVIVVGAAPLFFLDYIATSKMDPEVVNTVVSGIVAACKEVNCALIGGETSEMPGVFAENNFDISGFIVGIVEEDQMLRPHDNIELGDVVIGLPSNGLHTNGYSLVRHVFDLDKNTHPLFNEIEELGCSLAKALLTPHPSYYEALKPALGLSKGIAHITGGGLYENVPRILPDSLGAVFDSNSWQKPEIFNYIEREGHVDSEEMYRVFNMGLGMVIVCDSKDVGSVLAGVPESVVVGEVTHRSNQSQKISIKNI